MGKSVIYWSFQYAWQIIIYIIYIIVDIILLQININMKQSVKYWITSLIYGFKIQISLGAIRTGSIKGVRITLNYSFCIIYFAIYKHMLLISLIILRINKDSLTNMLNTFISE